MTNLTNMISTAKHSNTVTAILDSSIVTVAYDSQKDIFEIVNKNERFARMPKSVKDTMLNKCYNQL